MEEYLTIASLDCELERKRKDKPLPTWLISFGLISIFIAFIILLISRFIIMYQYPDAIYLEFHLQLSERYIASENSYTIYPIITMRYTSCNINTGVYGQSLAIWIDSIAYYGMVCIMCFSGVFSYELTGYCLRNLVHI